MNQQWRRCAEVLPTPAGADADPSVTEARENDPFDSAESLLFTAALSALPEAEATILRLRHESCLDLEQIGNTMGLSVADVRGGWVRGLKMLRGLYRSHAGQTAWQTLDPRSLDSREAPPSL
jgi:DNA-directed RNA polymerase specialized sigma24 family protein